MTGQAPVTQGPIGFLHPSRLKSSTDGKRVAYQIRQGVWATVATVAKEDKQQWWEPFGWSKPVAQVCFGRIALGRWEERSDPHPIVVRPWMDEILYGSLTEGRRGLCSLTPAGEPRRLKVQREDVQGGLSVEPSGLAPGSPVFLVTKTEEKEQLQKDLERGLWLGVLERQEQEKQNVLVLGSMVAENRPGDDCWASDRQHEHPWNHLANVLASAGAGTSEPFLGSEQLKFAFEDLQAKLHDFVENNFVANKRLEKNPGPYPWVEGLDLPASLLIALKNQRPPTDEERKKIRSFVFSWMHLTARWLVWTGFYPDQGESLRLTDQISPNHAGILIGAIEGHEIQGEDGDLDRNLEKRVLTKLVDFANVDPTTLDENVDPTTLDDSLRRKLAGLGDKLLRAKQLESPYYAVLPSEEALAPTRSLLLWAAEILGECGAVALAAVWSGSSDWDEILRVLTERTGS